MMQDWWSFKAMADARRQELLREAERERLRRQARVPGPDRASGWAVVMAASGLLATVLTKLV